MPLRSMQAEAAVATEKREVFSLTPPRRSMSLSVLGGLQTMPEALHRSDLICRLPEVPQVPQILEGAADPEEAADVECTTTLASMRPQGTVLMVAAEAEAAESMLFRTTHGLRLLAPAGAEVHMAEAAVPVGTEAEGPAMDMEPPVAAAEDIRRMARRIWGEPAKTPLVSGWNLRERDLPGRGIHQV